jgi:hypothetical protein
VQRFGSGLGLNLHAHLLSLDGVCVTDRPGGAPTFHAAPTLTDIEVARVHHDARQRIERVLRARGLLREPGDEPAEVKGAEESLLPFLQAASAQSRVAGGPDSGRSIPRLIDPSAVGVARQSLAVPRGALKAESGGYSLHAATRIPANGRDNLEHLLRYMARPPLCQGRLMLRDDGKVICNLRKPWRDGARSFVFDPLVFIGGPIVRFGVRPANGGGSAVWGSGLNASLGWSAGTTRRFQVWYRDAFVGPCGSHFNLTHAAQVTAGP